jgi:hypothetical protein
MRADRIVGITTSGGVNSDTIKISVTMDRGRGKAVARLGQKA